ncbi:MAG: heat-inducible transcription repressor HrcA [Elusimicrobia bacterium GWA2_69_24]|nr:MAG: heat-inducible transcription repressor HrcA [Elusimicrobia bacterium GWA2_69_24]HBL17733.1 heat-inducible transcription repressor HrcA [Elusimicrobiota bacterium]
MRQLKPDVAVARKRKVLQWVIHNFIKTSRPIASSTVAEEAGLDLSSATIRSILKELEDEGFLAQVHTSSGRVPTDRGYRFYVDYLQDMQRLASNEKARIEQQYSSRLEELDQLLSHTSTLLSHVSHKTGLVLSPEVEGQRLKRIELIPLGPKRLLAIVVTQTGLVRHWPIRLRRDASSERLNSLNRFLNDHIAGSTLPEVHDALLARIDRAEGEVAELQELAGQLLHEIDAMETTEELYLDGTTRLMEGAEQLGDWSQIQSLMRVLEDRRALTDVLQQEMKDFVGTELAGDRSPVRVRIGMENSLPELRNLSLITTTYHVGDRPVGVLGILGDKRMEYSRMISLVDHIGRAVSRTLETWEAGEAGSDAEK